MRCRPEGGGPRVVVSTAAFHARVRGSVPGLGGLKETTLFLPHPRVKVSIVGSLRDREVACSASDRQGSNFESCVWRTVSSQSSHHPQEVLLAQFSLYVHKGGLKPDSFHFICVDPREQNASVTASRFFHVAQSVFLPLPWKKYTISQPLSAWKKGRALHLLGPNAVAISWAPRNLTCLSTPHAIHWIWLRHWDATTTSVSTLSQPSLTMSCVRLFLCA